MPNDSKSKRNLRLGLILGMIALAFFIGFILHSWLLRS